LGVEGQVAAAVTDPPRVVRGSTRRRVAGVPEGASAQRPFGLKDEAPIRGTEFKSSV